ncbi:hypothetical protein Bca4012_005090 [Brassica carinata]|uniref:polyprenol reductase 1-like n=1 Tax=Brassica napus TaxID=3708 RepID=UPI002079F198|nr:polyprenol reductase 1-like [Brassica napus]
MELGIWIVWLVRAPWIAAILLMVIASIPSSKLRLFHELVWSITGRGKILPPSSSQKWTVPQKYFAHFYVFGVAWTTLLLAITWMHAFKMAPLSSEEFMFSRYLTGGYHVESQFKVRRAVFLLLLMEIQVSASAVASASAAAAASASAAAAASASAAAAASMKTVVVRFADADADAAADAAADYCSFRRRRKLRSTPTLPQEAYYYAAAPLSLCVNLVAGFISKGKDHISSSEFDLLSFLSPLMNLGWCQLIGGAIFLWGWLHQRRCHAILGSLRKSPSQAKEYIIPHGDWFDIVSSPHYLAEIVLYVGLLIASGGTDITVWLLFGSVVGNLSLSAGETHRWYLLKFEHYPANRNAIFPYVY